MDDTDEWVLQLDGADLRAFDTALFQRLVRYPSEVRVQESAARKGKKNPSSCKVSSIDFCVLSNLCLAAYRSCLCWTWRLRTCSASWWASRAA